MALTLIVSSCFFYNPNQRGKQISVSIPVVAYFIQRIAGNNVTINTMIPKSVGHGDYSPRPSQMVDVSNSIAYFAIGNLDFELTWRERIADTNDSLLWFNLNEGISLLNVDSCSSHVDEHEYHSDPHYWMSPRRAKTFALNINSSLKQILPECSAEFDSACNVFVSEIDALDSCLIDVASKSDSISFVIYHPALTYLAHDYGFRQIEIEHDGNSPSPQTYISELQLAREMNANVVFVQPGYDIQKANNIAESISASVVEFSPESFDWFDTMSIIIKALNK